MVKYINKEKCKYYSDLETMVFRGKYYNSKLTDKLSILPMYFTNNDKLNCLYYLDQNED